MFLRTNFLACRNNAFFCSGPLILAPVSILEVFGDGNLRSGQDLALDIARSTFTHSLGHRLLALAADKVASWQSLGPKVQRAEDLLELEVVVDVVDVLKLLLLYLEEFMELLVRL